MVVTLKPSLTLSREQAQAIVDRIVPDRRVSAVVEFLNGEIGRVYAIDFADGEPGFVFKAYAENLRWRIPKELVVARLRGELLDALAPRIVLVEEDFFVMTQLPGENLMAIDSALPPADSASAYAQMGRALRQIHGIEMEAFGYIGGDGIWQPVPSNRAYMQAEFERKLDDFAQFGGDADLAKRLQATVAERLPLLDGCTKPLFCHGDFHTGNMLVERRDGALVLSGVLDWENAIAGDPLMDIAKTLHYSVRDDAAKRAALLSGYGPIERSDWQVVVEFYEFYGKIELWAWWTHIGDHERAMTVLPDLRRLVSAR